MREPTWNHLIGNLPGLPQTPTIGSRRSGYAIRLDQTRTLLQAVRLTAEQEIRERGLNPETVGNPVDRLIYADAAPPLFSKIANAISAAATGNRFATPNRPHLFTEGARVRLVRHPAEDIGLDVDLETEGTLTSHEPSLDWGDGWNVDFEDGWGTYWTTTESLELL